MGGAGERHGTDYYALRREWWALSHGCGDLGAAGNSGTQCRLAPSPGRRFQSPSIKSGIVRLTERELADRRRSKLLRGALMPLSEHGSAVLLENMAAVRVAVLSGSPRCAWYRSLKMSRPSFVLLRFLHRYRPANESRESARAEP